MRWPSKTLAVIFLFLLPSQQGCREPEAPFSVGKLFDFSQPETLGLDVPEGMTTVTVFSPGESKNKYNNGAVLFPFRGKLYAQWQSSEKDEDAEDTRVLYCTSDDGKVWSDPSFLTEKRDSVITTGGGWWSDGEMLTAFINVWPIHKNKAREGYTEFINTSDGLHWDKPGPVTDINGQPLMGIIEQDLHALPSGRLITAFHLQPGLIATPFYTDDKTGTSGWRQGLMPHLPFPDEETSRELEPSWFYRKDGAAVMIFRDQGSSFRKIASVSSDNGSSWSMPAIVDTPDSRSKQCAGNLPDGTAYMINNPSGNKNRFPLVITLSRDGFIFDRAFLLRSGGKDLQPLRFNGRYKKAGYHYPKSIIWGDYLYVSYSTNKEDIEVTRIPVKALKYE